MIGLFSRGDCRCVYTYSNVFGLIKVFNFAVSKDLKFSTPDEILQKIFIITVKKMGKIL